MPDGCGGTTLEPKATSGIQPGSRIAPAKVPLTVDANPAPRLSPDRARRLLEACDVPFVFFADAETGRGCVLYQRYDGDYGLIVPSDEGPSALGRRAVQP